MNSTIIPGSVIAAVDGSIHARRGVLWAADQAHLEGRPLVVVHATGVRHGQTIGWRSDLHGDEAWLYDVSRSSRVLLEEAVELAEEAHPTLPVKSASIAGDPRGALVSVSASARLVVLGSRGRGPIASKLGSVSAAVAKRAACPVVVTRSTSPGAVKDGVVVGADGTAESLPIIEFAFRQASLHRLPLTVMHCVYDPVAAVVGARGPANDLPDADEHLLLLGTSVAGLAEKYPDVHMRTQLNRGRFEDCLVAGPRPWHLIVIGRHPVTPFRSSNSTRVLERSECVVAVVPEAAPVRS